MYVFNGCRRYGCGQDFVNGVQDWHNCALKKKSIALKKCSRGQTNGLAQRSVWEERAKPKEENQSRLFFSKVFHQFIATGVFFTYISFFGDSRSY